MGTTPINAFPYPEITEPADVPADIKELALALDPKVKPARPFRLLAGTNAGVSLPYTGPGFVIAKTGTGVYTVTFSPALVAPIVPVVGPVGAAQGGSIFNAIADIAAVTTTLLTVRTYNGISAADAGFSFIVMSGTDPGGV